VTPSWLPRCFGLKDADLAEYLAHFDQLQIAVGPGSVLRPAQVCSKSAMTVIPHTSSPYPQCCGRWHHGRHCRPRPAIRLNKRMADLGLCSRQTELDARAGCAWMAGCCDGPAGAINARVDIDRQASGATPAGHHPDPANRWAMSAVGRRTDCEPAVALVQPKTAGANAGNRMRSGLRAAAGSSTGQLDIDSIGLLVLTAGRPWRASSSEDSDVENYLVRA
jgi:hypothetical protein